MPYEEQYEPEEVARLIASEDGKDKFNKHVLGQEDFKKYGKGGTDRISTRGEYETVIAKTLRDPETQCFRGQTWDMYYNKKNNLFVGVDRANPVKSTAYPPPQKKAETYFLKQLEKDNEKRPEKGLEPTPLQKGGYGVLYPGRAKEQSQDRDDVRKKEEQTKQPEQGRGEDQPKTPFKPPSKSPFASKDKSPFKPKRSPFSKGKGSSRGKGSKGKGKGR